MDRFGVDATLLDLSAANDGVANVDNYHQRFEIVRFVSGCFEKQRRCTVMILLFSRKFAICIIPVYRLVTEQMEK